MAGLIRPIEIQNLRELQAALRQADGESQKQIRVVFNAAADIVVDDARRLVPRGPSGAAGASLKALSGQREGKAVGGSKKAPHYGWLEFGGKVGRKRSIERRFIQGGRYLYPSYAKNRERILEEMAEGLAQVARNAGLEVT